MSALISLPVAALEKRYSIWLTSGAPGARSAATSDGSTQAWAVWVIEVAKPTMVRCGDPGTPVTVICVPICSPGPRGVVQHDLVRLRRPVAGLQREVVHRAARRRTADHGQLRLEHAAAGRPGLAGRRGHGDGRGDRRLGEGPGRRGHPRQVRGGGELGGARPDGRGHLRAVLGRERVVERRVRVDQQAEGQRRGGGRDQQDQADHHGLHAPAGQPAARGPDGRARCRRRPDQHGPHRRAPVVLDG